MNKILVIILAVCSSALHGQDIKTVLSEIETNHPSLQAALKENQARAEEYKTTLQPPNPEVEYGYFPGNTSAVGTKKVFGIAQRFAFPTEYKSRKGMSEARSSYDHAEYQELRRKKLLEAKILLLRYVYHRHQLKTANQHLEWTVKFKEDIKKLYEKGSVPGLDVSKARMQVTRARNEKRKLESKIKSDSIQILMLNNRHQLSGLYKLEYPPLRDAGRENFIEEYITHHPRKQIALANQNKSNSKTRLRKNAYLPDLKVGWESEQVLDESHRGFKAGITLPLWEKRHSVSSAKLAGEAAKLQLQAVNNQLEAEAASYWTEWQTLKTIYLDYQRSLKEYDHPEKLRSAYQKNEISSTALFYELETYFEFKIELIDYQFMAYEAQAKLFSFAL
ncbi:MAG: TolC family protein [Bacteroidota bacterium]